MLRQLTPAAETNPPARTLLMVRTGASVGELSNTAHSLDIALDQILETAPVRVNPRNILVPTQFPIARLLGNYPAIPSGDSI